MVEWWTVGLGTLLTVLSGLLTVVAALASRRFEDRRFVWVGIAFFTVGVTGFFSILSEFFGFADEAFAVEPGPLILLVIAVTALYVAVFRRPPSPRAPGDGRTS
jgi:hypothetical protein